jgi:hypothetical protein
MTAERFPRDSLRRQIDKRQNVLSGDSALRFFPQQLSADVKSAE